MSATPLRLYDFLHGEMQLDGDLQLIYFTHAVQRLSRLAQCPFASSKFPAMTHSRLTHALGSYCVAQQMINALTRHDAAFAATKEERDNVLVATLCRNVGRAPFDDFWPEICQTQRKTKSEYKERSAAIFREIVRTTLRHWSAPRVERVVDLICSVHYTHSPAWSYDVVKFAAKFDAALRNAALAQIHHKFDLYATIKGARVTSDSLHHIAFEEQHFAEFTWLHHTLRYQIYSNPARVALFFSLNDALRSSAHYYRCATQYDAQRYFLHLDDNNVVAYAEAS
jgi:hypothetical protein